MASLVWPFPSKSSSQYQQVDQGWDLKGPIGVVKAAAPGTIMYAHDPSGFGKTYPVLMLDQPTVYGKGIYYGHVVPIVRQGTHVKAGQAIATTALGPQGNATQWGWLEIGWWNNGPTGNGAGMRTALLQSSAPETSNGMALAAGNVQFTYGQLESVWNQAGGNQQAAPIAAAIAMAESGGNSAAYDNDSNGSVDRGLWQINSVHGAQSTFDVMANARAAVAISNNGTNWSPWVTYQTGAYRQFLQSNVPPDSSAPINATNGAANQGGAPTQATETSLFGDFTCIVSPLNCVIKAGESVVGKAILSVIGIVLNPLIEIFAGVLGIAGGAILVFGGIYIIVMESTDAGQKAGTALSLVGMATGQPELMAAGGGVSSMARQRIQSVRGQQTEARTQARQEATGRRQVTIAQYRLTQAQSRQEAAGQRQAASLSAQQQRQAAMAERVRMQQEGMTTREQLRNESLKYRKKVS